MTSHSGTSSERSNTLSVWDALAYISSQAQRETFNTSDAQADLYVFMSSVHVILKKCLLLPDIIERELMGYHITFN
jgi:hypothetical protein